jgi:hypothetical protein
MTDSVNVTTADADGYPTPLRHPLIVAFNSLIHLLPQDEEHVYQDVPMWEAADELGNAIEDAVARAEAAERLNGELVNALRLIAHGDFEWAVDDAAAWAQRTLDLVKAKDGTNG